MMMAEKAETELLNMVYKNAEMGRDGLYYVLRRTDDTGFRRSVETQFMEYQQVMDEAEDKLRENGASPKGTNPAEKAMVRCGAIRRAAADNSPAALAEMLIQGSCMGVTKIARQISRFRCEAPAALELADRLQKTEENNIEKMKAYL